MVSSGSGVQDWASGTEPAVPLPGRACGKCTLCCKLQPVHEIGKPAFEWCPHCTPGQGCSIYATRPAGCRVFHCGWRLWPQLGDEWRPDLSKLVVYMVGKQGERRLTVNVDPSRPAAWRRPDLYAKLRQWAIGGYPTLTKPLQFLVTVRIGPRIVVILPDREVDLGIPAADEMIVTREKVSSRGAFVEVEKVKRSAIAAPD